MFLLVEFSYRLINFLDYEDIIQDDKILVEAPEDLPKSEFKNFVMENYFNDIFNIAQYSNILGSNDLTNFRIDNVSYIGLIQKIQSKINKIYKKSNL